MGYSTIIQKPCKCGCGKMPTTSFRGYNMDCRPDIKEELKKKHNAKQYQKQKVSKLVREQMQNGNHEDASVQALKNDLDFVFSRIVRMSAANTNGQCGCYTCHVAKHWSLMQCGHFIKRGNTEIRWSFQNAKPQCKVCNETLSGNLEMYEQRLEAEHKGLPEQLRERAREPYKWSREELKQLLIDLRHKLRLIESKFQTNG